MNTGRDNYLKRPAVNGESSDTAWKVAAVIIGVIGGVWLLRSAGAGLVYLALIVGVPALALYWIIRLAVAHGTKR